MWITNKFGNSERGRAKILGDGARGESQITTAILDPACQADPRAGRRHGRTNAWLGGRQSDGPAPRRHGGENSPPTTAKGIYGPWAVSVDGNDNIWVSNFTSPKAGIVQLCGFRPETCPPGVKTGEAISPPGGYVGGGLQLQVDIDIGPAGDVWVTNNWQDHDVLLRQARLSPSRLFAPAQELSFFFGMAKPVHAPQIGPARGL